MKFDLSPTARLAGLHFEGIVERRFLISYPVAPRALATWLPPGSEPSLRAGSAWISACFVEMRAMRPAPMPAALGTRFRYLVHRTRARLPFPDGRRREAVLVLEASVDRLLPQVLGRFFTGVRFVRRDIALTAGERGWSLLMNSGSDVLFEVEVERSSLGSVLPVDSRFRGVDEADDFLLGVAYGGDWNRTTQRLSLLAETHAPWTTQAAACVTVKHALLADLGEPARADHVLTMTEVPHYFGMCPARVVCDEAQMDAQSAPKPSAAASAGED